MNQLSKTAASKLPTKIAGDPMSKSAMIAKGDMFSVGDRVSKKMFLCCSHRFVTSFHPL